MKKAFVFLSLLMTLAASRSISAVSREPEMLELSGDYLLFHAYHGQTGKSALQISTMVWEDGWPRVGALP